jgi:hypothetical protein
MVRAKFTVTTKKPRQGGGSDIVLTPQYDPNAKDDEKYAKSTPSGSITLVVDNPPAEAAFEVGKAYYVDFNAA